MKRYKRKKAYAVLLALPPIVALIMIGAISFTNQAVIVDVEGVFLSPVQDATPLIFSLIIFIVGYLVFMGILFKESLVNLIPKKVLHKK